MAKNKTTYICSSCGEVSGKWEGQCVSCKEWGTVAESQSEQSFTKLSHNNQPLTLEAIDGKMSVASRVSTRISELDRVLGGGIVVPAPSHLHN